MQEWILALGALVGVAALAFGRGWGWLVATLASLGYARFFVDLGLYGMASVQVVFAATQVAGWWGWGQQSRFRSRPGVWPTLGLVLPLGAGFALFLQPADAILTAFSLVVQGWTSAQALQCWRMWLVLDLATAGLMGQRQAYPSAALYLIFALLAESAHRYWGSQAGSGPSVEKEPALCMSANSNTPS